MYTYIHLAIAFMTWTFGTWKLQSVPPN